MALNFAHCNLCYCRPSRENDFYLTSCGHLFCGNCICKDSLGNGICILCKAGFSRIKLTRENMTDEIKLFFGDPQNLINKAVKVLNFQTGHLIRYASHCEIETKKLKAENIRFRKREEKLMQALAQSDREIQRFQGNRKVDENMFFPQPPTVKQENFGSNMYASSFGGHNTVASSSRSGKYSQPSYMASQGFKLNGPRLSLEPQNGLYRRPNKSDTPTSSNMKSMSASSGSSYFSAEKNFNKKSVKVSPFSSFNH